MAKIKDIIAGEDSSKQVIKLYKEGIFYKAYEYSAYLFVKHIKAYQVKRKYSVQLKQDLVSIGFPITSFSSLSLPQNASVKDFGDLQEISLSKENIDLQGFEEWKASIPMMEPKVKDNVNKASVGGNGSFAVSSLEYDCMLFLSELKRSLNLVNKKDEL